MTRLFLLLSIASIYAVFGTGNRVEAADSNLALSKRLEMEMQALESSGPSVDRFASVGQLYRELKDFRNAARFLHLAAERDDATPEITRQLVYVYLEAGKSEGALSVLNSGVERFPQSIDLLLLLGDGLSAMQRFPQAMEAYRKAMELDAEYPQVRFKLAQAWYRKGDFEQVESLLSPLVDSENPPVEVALLHGKAQFQGGKVRQALRRLETLYQIYSDDSTVRDGLVEMYLGSAMKEGDAGRVSRTIDLLEKARSIVPENVKVLMGLALFHGQFGEAEMGMQYYRDILAIDSKQLQVYILLGRLQRKEGLSDEAEATFEEGLAHAREQQDKAHIEALEKVLKPLE